METGLPQDLVGEEVADAGYERLVHQGGLRAAPPAGQAHQELGSVDIERVRPEIDERCLELAMVPGEPDAAEASQVAVAELAVLEDDDQAVVSVPLGLVTRPHQVAGHPEMEQQDRTAGRAQQPLAVSAGLLEGMASQGQSQVLRRGVPNDLRVGHVHGPHYPARGVLLEEAAMDLDLG